MPSGGLWPEKISLCSEQDVSYRCISDLQVEKLGTLGPMAASERLRN
jgi:hypothetical protein